MSVSEAPSSEGRSTTPRWSRLVWLLLPALASVIALSACEDEFEPGRVEGTVRLMPEDSLLVDIRLVLLDHRSMGVVAGPVRTNDQGRFHFEVFREGVFYPVPVLRQELQLDRNPLSVEVVSGRTSRLDLRLIRSELWDSQGLALTGRVVDSESGRALRGALVSPAFGDPTRYFVGATLPSEDFTDDEGRFELRSVPVNTRTSKTFTITVTLAGYLPYAFQAPAPKAGEPDSIHVDLELVQGHGEGAISGRVVKDGVARAEVPVMLDFHSDAPVIAKQEAKAPLLGFSTTTDAEGGYRFEGLSPGIYTVVPGYLPDDGIYFFLYSENRHAEVELSEGEHLTIPDLILGETIEPLLPSSGATVTSARPDFEWTSVPGADSYRLNFAIDHNYGDPITVTEAHYHSTDPYLDGTTVRWHVYAFSGDRVIGGFERSHTFTVDLSAERPD